MPEKSFETFGGPEKSRFFANLEYGSKKSPISFSLKEDSCSFKTALTQISLADPMSEERDSVSFCGFLICHNSGSLDRARAKTGGTVKGTFNFATRVGSVDIDCLIPDDCD